MADDSRPQPIDESFAAALRLTKAQVLQPAGTGVAVVQYGAALLPSTDRPPWPVLPAVSDAEGPVIETYLGSPDAVGATSDNEPHVSAWLALASWMNTTVRTSLAEFGVALEGDAYLTASLTPRSMHEGTPHLDDDVFRPDDDVGVVAIIGELAGPTVAAGRLEHAVPAPSTQLSFDDGQASRFAAGDMGRSRCAADELVVFPQFGQLHAGPTVDDLPAGAPARQLLVLRARAVGVTRRPATPR